MAKGDKIPKGMKLVRARSVRIPARPYMRPGLALAQKDVIATINRSVDRGIDAARSLAKK